MRFVPSACLLSLVFSLSPAAPLPVAAPGAKAQAPHSEFTAIIIGTIQYAHGDAWAYTPAATGPRVHGADELVPGQRLSIVLSLHSFAVDRAGQADVIYDLVITQPDGTKQTVGTGLKAVFGRVADPHMVYRAAQSAAFAIPAGQPPGSYTFNAHVTDRVGKAELNVGGAFTLVDGSVDRPLPAGFDLDKASTWLTTYYEHPDPRFALSVLGLIARDENLAKNRNTWPPILGAYETILRDNPWLVERFIVRFAAPDTPVIERDRLLFILAYVYRDVPRFGEFLPESMRANFRRAQQQKWPIPEREILSGAQLDILWGRFLASGEIMPLRQLVAALDYEKFKGSLEAFKKLDPKPEVTPPGCYKEAVYAALLWSLKTNNAKHRLVHDYLTYLANDPSTTADRRRQLAGILAAKTP